MILFGDLVEGGVVKVSLDPDYLLADDGERQAQDNVDNGDNSQIKEVIILTVTKSYAETQTAKIETVE